VNFRLAVTYLQSHFRFAFQPQTTVLQLHGFELPFVKRFALRYRTRCPVLSCMSVTLVYCGQTVGWIKMKLGVEVGLGPGHIVLDGDPALPERGTAAPFSVHVYCGQTVAHLGYC